uniref:Cilium assembly protein DZIP1 n=1 Tax=Phallusia mammillata TaxID=59560 RepID=A0A6F9DAX7_9ASCI|nr:zinc finger protein DZIP1L [Phallusia mammillata]
MPAGRSTYGASRGFPGVDHSFELDPVNFQEPVPAFHFRKRFGEIDWRKLSSIDVDRVARELDFVTLQENISVVTFCNIDAVSDLDPLFSKLFKLSQYTIEYLLHSQEYLQSVVSDLEAKLGDAAKAHEELEHKLDEQNEEMVKLQQENKRRRKMIQQQQLLIESGATSYYQCPHCEKAFMNASFLQGHMQRRHPGSVNYIGDVIAHSQKEQTKLGNHLKQLEGELTEERENFNRKLRQAEEDKLRWAEQSRREMDEWKEAEEAKWKGEFDSLRESFLQDISKLKEKEHTYQKTIGRLQETMEIKSSNLGELVDDVEEEKQKLRQYEDRVKQLEEISNYKNQQIAALSNAMKRIKQEQLTKEEKEQILRSQQKQFDDINSRMAQSELRARKTQQQAKKLAKSPKPKRKPRPDLDMEMDGGYQAPTEDERRRNLLELKRSIDAILPSLVDDKLRQCGVDHEVKRIIKKKKSTKLRVLKAQRQQKAKSFPALYKLRDDSRKKVDQMASKKFDETMQSSSKRKKPKPAASLPKQRLTQSLHEPRGVARKPVPSSAPRSKPRSQSQRETQPLPVAVTQQTPMTSSSPRAAPRKSRDDLDDLRSPWDSEDEDTEGDDDVTPKVSPPTGGRQRKDSDWDEDIDDILTLDDFDAPPTGQGSRVKQLGANIQQQLTTRKRPPAGAVDVTPRGSTGVERLDLSDDDEEDSFLVSSLEDGKESPAVRPSSSRALATGGAGASTSTSVWGSGKRPGDQTKDYNSDFEDLELDELLA